MSDIDANLEITTPVIQPQQSNNNPTQGQKVTADDLLDMYDDIPEESPVVESKEEATTGETKEGEVKEEVKSTLRKAKLNDSEIDIDESALIKDTIAGKEVEFKVGDAIKAFKEQEEFNRGIDQRLRFVDSKEKTITKKERALTEEYDTLASKAASIVRLSGQGDIDKLLDGIVKMAVGQSTLDPVELKSVWLDKIRAIVNDWGKATPEQREIWKAQQRAKYAEEEIKQLQTKTQVKESETVLLTQIDDACSTLGIKRAEFSDFYKDFVKKYVGNHENSVVETVDEVQVSDIVGYIQNKRHEANVIEAVKSVAPNKASDDNLIDLIYTTTHGHGLDADGIKEIVMDVLKQPTKGDENLNRKVQKAAKAGFGTQSSAVSSTKKQNEEIDEEMWEHFFGNRKVR